MSGLFNKDLACDIFLSIFNEEIFLTKSKDFNFQYNKYTNFHKTLLLYVLKECHETLVNISYLIIMLILSCLGKESSYVLSLNNTLFWFLF